jgi:hypothetical protein
VDRPVTAHPLEVSLEARLGFSLPFDLVLDGTADPARHRTVVGFRESANLREGLRL